MKYSILHISDIHKAPGVEYASLFQSMRRDFEYYTENECILAPSFVVVSGDLIQGAYTDDEIRQQYDNVALFLSDICHFFLKGDRKRLIIVPGNHDVNRNTTMASMIPATKKYECCLHSFFSGATDLRWNWKDCQFYEIMDPAIYNSRFSQFVEFYNKFYDGIRQYPNNPEEKAFVVIDNIYEICFSCFNSCHCLDHLCDTGSITEEALNSVCKELTDCYNAGYLNIAVWHHHFYGRPMETNYIDRAFLNNLLSCNIQMGLYGHQHYTQVAEEYSDLLLQKDKLTQRLLLISSGTLFGGEKVLSANCRRQYNIIEIEKGNGYAAVDINIREDFNPNRNNKIPHWRLKPLSNSTNKIHYDIRLRELSINDILLKIDRECKISGDFHQACEAIKLLQQKTGKDFTPIFKLYLKEVKDYDYVFKNVGKVTSIEDAVLKIVAAQQAGNSDYIQEIIADRDIYKLNDSNVNSLLTTLKNSNI